MRPEIAYPLMPRYEDRIAQRFERGQSVTIGPAYITETHYNATDSYTWTRFVVVDVIPPTSKECPYPEYALARDSMSKPVLWVLASRLQPLGGPNG